MGKYGNLKITKDKLSGDAAEAKKRGMSYGQYKAMQWDKSAPERARLAATRAKRERQQKLDAGWIECENPNCHELFKPRNSAHRHCSPVCATEHYNMRITEEKERERNQS